MKFALLVPLLALCGCGTAVVETVATLKPSSALSTIVLDDGTALTIEKSFEGGATGDTLHKAWICKQRLQDCQLAATVDTHNDEAPSWRRTGPLVELVIANADTVWGFCNYFRKHDGSELRVRLTVH
jgi:hypothetical protein